MAASTTSSCWMGWRRWHSYGLPRWQRDARATANAREARRLRALGDAAWRNPTRALPPDEQKHEEVRVATLRALVKRYPPHRCSVAYWREFLAKMRKAQRRHHHKRAR